MDYRLSITGSTGFFILQISIAKATPKANKLQLLEFRNTFFPGSAISEEISISRQFYSGFFYYKRSNLYADSLCRSTGFPLQAEIWVNLYKNLDKSIQERIQY